MDANKSNKSRVIRTDLIRSSSRIRALEIEDPMMSAHTSPWGPHVGVGRKRKEGEEREAGCGDDDGPFLGCPGLELGCGQFVFFLTTLFPFSFPWF